MHWMVNLFSQQMEMPCKEEVGDPPIELIIMEVEEEVVATLVAVRNTLSFLKKKNYVVILVTV